MAVSAPPSAMHQALNWIPAALPNCKVERVQELSKMRTLGLRNLKQMSWDTVQALSYDPLTSLPMARLFEARVDYLLQESDNPFALIIINCQKFRLVNEIYGREVANYVLRLLARRFSKLDQPSVFCARLRDDRFGFIVNKAHRHLAEDFIEHLQQVLAKPMRFRGQRYQLGFAMGIHWRQQNEEQSAQDLILDAETTLAHARSKASQEVVAVFEHPLVTQSNEASLAEQLALQLDSDTLPIKVFPVINLRTHAKYSYQAVPCLLDNGEEVPLDITFKLAERHGLMLKLTQYVVDRAIEQLGALYQQAAMYLSVKVSRLDMNNCELMEATYQTLQKSNLPAHKFKFELHEEMRSTEWQDVINDIFELAQADCPRQFKRARASAKPLNKSQIQINKVVWLHASLIKRVQYHPQQQRILRTVIDLARSHGVDVMLDGLEDAKDAELGLDLGILFGQGCAFGNPESIILPACRPK